MCDPCCGPCGSCGPCPVGCGTKPCICDCCRRNGIQDKCPLKPCRLRRSLCGSSGCCSPCGSCSPCGAPCGDYPCCGPYNPPCGAPCPVPCSACTPGSCPPMMEAGLPDPRVWNSCNTPQTYPFGF